MLMITSCAKPFKVMRHFDWIGAARQNITLEPDTAARDKPFVAHFRRCDAVAQGGYTP